MTVSWSRRLSGGRLVGKVKNYGLFFADKIEVYKMTSDEASDCPGYSDKQHRGNEGEPMSVYGVGSL